MNYEQANSVKKLAAPINKVLEGLEVECPDCKDHLMHQGLGCKYSGKVKYSHTPQVGEWCLLCGKQAANSELFLVSDKDDIDYVSSIALGETVPILPWEEIERVLEKNGYKVSIVKEIGKDDAICNISIQYTCDVIIRDTFGNSRQKAVMKAVIALGKERLKEN